MAKNCNLIFFIAAVLESFTLAGLLANASGAGEPPLLFTFGDSSYDVGNTNWPKHSIALAFGTASLIPEVKFSEGSQMIHHATDLGYSDTTTSCCGTGSRNASGCGYSDVPWNLSSDPKSFLVLRRASQHGDN
ncbi:unnamed protein product [Microthlaspi erraticum]|uniref:GDSL esterase/lipase n=1 Tax=Microthlaspi erraticum TaxID=1685480 RepID=A0A6D2I7W7_9BRAS|nr:unnamed protein product [Microthlaspi erraticum]